MFYILKKPQSIIIIVAIFLVIVLGISILPELGIIKAYFSVIHSFEDRVSYIWRLIMGLGNQTPILQDIFIFVIGILSGIYIALMRYAWKNKVRSMHKSGFLGILASFFGVGCAACGSFLLSGLLGILGLGAVLASLPLHGGEILFIAILLLLWAIYKTNIQLLQLNTCRIADESTYAKNNKNREV